MNLLETGCQASELKIAVVCSRWNRLVTDRLLDGATSFFLRNGGNKENLDVAWVPGAAEIPVVLNALGQKKAYDALVAVSAIISGETSHHQLIASVVAGGITSVTMKYSLPVGIGVLTVQNMNQALDRSGGKSGNKGEEAMAAALESANMIKMVC